MESKPSTSSMIIVGGGCMAATSMWANKLTAASLGALLCHLVRVTPSVTQLPANSAQLKPLQGHAGVCGNHVPAATWSVHSPPTLLRNWPAYITSTKCRLCYRQRRHKKHPRPACAPRCHPHVQTHTHAPAWDADTTQKAVCAAKKGSPKLAGNKPATDKTRCYSWHTSLSLTSAMYTNMSQLPCQKLARRAHATAGRGSTS